MRRRWYPAVLLGLLVVGLGTAPAAAAAAADEPGPITLPADSLVADGGFEPPGVEEVGGYTGYTAADAKPLGAWTVVANGVDLVSADPAAEGTQFIDLNGNDESKPGSISQVVAATPGHRYRVQFQLAGNPNGDPPVKALDVSFGGVSQSFTFEVGDNNSDDLGWAPRDFEAALCGTPASGSPASGSPASGSPESGATLTFTSTTDGQRGPLVDAVAVVDLGPGCGAGTPVWQLVMLGGTGAAWVAAFVFLGTRLMRRRRPALR